MFYSCFLDKTSQKVGIDFEVATWMLFTKKEKWMKRKEQIVKRTITNFAFDLYKAFKPAKPRLKTSYIKFNANGYKSQIAQINKAVCTPITMSDIEKKIIGRDISFMQLTE